MPTNSKPHTITQSQAIEAIRVMSSLASAISDGQPTPPFSYGTGPGEFPMTAGNSLPAMIVWLFLVTNPDYLAVLDGTAGAVASLVPISLIVQKTNLIEQCVTDILACYQKDKTSFHAVADQFQAYSQSSGYPVGHCPGNANAILQLATLGAAVDPNAINPAPPS